MENKARIITLFLTILLFVAGCGYKEGVRNTEPQSYLWFTGNTSGAVVYVDDNQPFELEASTLSADSDDTDAQKKSLTYYQTTPGKHNVIVKRNGEVVVNRAFMIGNGMTKEIQIP